ncbi:MAG: diphthine--ammonia ligase [Nanobdellota archaeon]
MCGIIGIFGYHTAASLITDGLTRMQQRGKDGIGFGDGIKTYQQAPDRNDLIGHTLHAIVDHVIQPIEGRFVMNGEIYNYQELNKEFNLTSKNDAQTALKLIEILGFHEAIKRLDGPFAIAYWSDDTIWLARDILGIKPLFFNPQGFASEAKVLEALTGQSFELNPRKICRLSLKDHTYTLEHRDFFEITQMQRPYAQIRQELKARLYTAIRKRIPDRKIGLLFSGGIDSTFLALVLKELNIPFTCYTAGIKQEGMNEAKDVTAAKEVARELNLPLRVKELSLNDVPAYLKKVVPLIEDSNVVKVGVALPFYLACEMAQEDDIKVLFSGLGSEEIFAGYNRHRQARDINKECRNGLLNMYERDLYRDDVVTMHHTIELRLPFLDHDLIRYALSIPPEYKINEKQSKVILREIAHECGLSEAFSERKKQAAQYGSNIDKAIAKLAKPQKKSEYLRQFLPRANLRLGVLFSSGKDSTYAAWIMQQQNYEITCLISLWSKNTESYMYHTPNMWITREQAHAMDIPLIVQETEGQKEAELQDLKDALEQAKENYGIQGIVTGALYSTYQRDRIQRIAEDLSLKVFNPLWHINQEHELRNLINEGFQVVMTAIAAEGLTQEWLGTPLTHAHVDRLVRLQETIGINVAGEGGEFESLVLDSPLFRYPLAITESRIVMENECTGYLDIKKVLNNNTTKSPPGETHGTNSDRNQRTG